MKVSPPPPLRHRHAAAPRVRWAAAALAGALWLAGCGGPSDAELVKSAKELIAKRDVEAARLQLKSALQANPNSAEARFLLGQLMHDSGDMAGAEAELRRALEGGHGENAVLPLLAGALVAQGKSTLLLQQYGRVNLTDAQADADLKVQLAMAEATENNTSGAQALLSAVLSRQPDHTAALLLQARLAAAGGDTAAARTQVDALLARQADNAEAWLFKAELLQAQALATPGGDTAPMVAAYRQVLKIKPDNVAAHAALVGLSLARNDLEGASTQWTAMQKALPRNPQTLFLEAVLAQAKGDHKRTREITQLLLRAAPDNVRVLMVAGQSELQLNAVTQAEAMFTKAVQAAPKAAGPRRQLAQTQLRSGQADKALATLRPLLEAEPPDVDALTLAAQAHLTKGDTAAADASFAKAAKLKPGDNRLRTAMAVASLAKGKDAAAYDELQAIAANDKGTAADMALINAKVRRNDLPGALKAVDALAAKLPGDPLPDQLRGRIALQRQDRAAARQAFEAALAKNADFMPALAGLAALDLADNKAAAAKDRFEALLKRQPGNAPAMLALAEIASRSGGTPADVAALLERAVKAEPGEATPRMLLADHHLNNGQPKAALDVAQAGVTALPDSPEMLDRLGRAQMASGQTQQAVVSFSKLASMAPKNPLPQLRLADAHAAAGNPTAVAAAVRRAVELAPDAPLVQQAQISLALQENKPDQALAVARKVQAQRPDDAAGFSQEGDVELFRRNWDAAATALRKAVAKKNPGDSAQRLHAALLAGKKTAEADKLAADWRKAHPDDMGFVMRLGDAALAGGQAEQAEQLYGEVLAKQPDNLVAMNNQAYVMALQKKPGAVAAAEKALAKAPNSPAVMDTVAFALAASQQLPRAIEMQTKAVAAAPEAHQFRLQLARLHLQAGDKPSARNELQTLAKLGGRFPQQAEVTALLKQTEG